LVLRSKVAVKLWSRVGREHHRRRHPLLVNLVLAHSEDSLLRRLRLARLQVAREAANSLNNPINLHPRRPALQVRVKREAEDERNKARFVNLWRSPGGEHRLQVTKEGKQSRSKERKRARGLHSPDRSKTLVYYRRPRSKIRGRSFQVPLTTRVVVTFMLTTEINDSGSWRERLYNSSAI
jgi:hypothetical protein